MTLTSLLAKPFPPWIKIQAENIKDLEMIEI